MRRTTTAAALFISTLYATINAIHGSLLWAAACTFVAGGIARQLYALMARRTRRR